MRARVYIVNFFIFPNYSIIISTPINVQDVEEESVGVKKAAPARGGSGSKRSRAAEVHNLSERVRAI